MSMTLVIQMESKFARELELRADADEVSVSEYVSQFALPFVQYFGKIDSGVSFFYPEKSTLDAEMTVHCSDELEQALLDLRETSRGEMPYAKLLYVFIGLHIEQPDGLALFRQMMEESAAMNKRLMEEWRRKRNGTN